MKRLLLAAGVLLAACATPDQGMPTMDVESVPQAQEPAVQASDPAAFPGFDTEAHLFLEEVEGEAALAWVRAENQRSLDLLKADPRFEELQAEALGIANAKERIPYGSIRNGQVYNFWQDETHVRGLWRRTPLDSYKTDAPEWETILDLDALAEDEDRNWVYKGVDCLEPEGRHCLVSLSDGGKDAVEIREFDMESMTFVDGGFYLSEAKSGVEWVDKDTLLVATDWGDGTLTTSGYPFIVKVLKRGQSMDQATEVMRGDEDDVGVWPMTVELGGGQRMLAAVESDTFFTSTYWWLPSLDMAPVKIDLPKRATVRGALWDKLVVSLEEDWTPEGQPGFMSGDLVSFDYPVFRAGRGKIPPVTLVFRPAEHQAIESVRISRDAVLIGYNDNVVGKVKVAVPNRTRDGWDLEDVNLPENGTAGIAFSSIHDKTVFLNYEGFLTPDSLMSFDPGTRKVETLKSLPAKFDVEGLVVDQNWAVSKDGTRVPYFLVRHEDTPMDGSTPTLLYGYGGFQVSLNPGYSGYNGKMWLENGGAYILANIRGGGEFGPAWHQAGLKTKRQVVYDDFIAIAEDAIEKGVTSKEHLGIQGGSNGGLLMGVMFTQRPDLFSAVICQVPLLDMLRYHKLLAGASWVDEYGSPEVAEEREWLEQLSPYHNIDPDTDYPEIFFVTSTKDDRVHPAHARKMAHRLQDLNKPFLYYENIDGGHSAAANLKETAFRKALETVYLMQKLEDAPAAEAEGVAAEAEPAESVEAALSPED